MIISVAAVVIPAASVSSSIALGPATLASELTTDELAEGNWRQNSSDTITDTNIATAGISDRHRPDEIASIPKQKIRCAHVG